MASPVVIPAVSYFALAIGAALVVIWVGTIADVVRRHLDRRQTFGWLLIVVLIPFVGALAYWVIRPSTPDEIRRQAAAGDPYDHPRSW